jgi:CTP:molybdopterin cytidylyltransferase MocA
MSGIRTNRVAAAFHLVDFSEARDRRLAWRGKPAPIGCGLFVAVRMLQGDKGARDLIAAAQENILELAAGDPATEIDIDTREDLRLLHAIRST